MFEWDDRKRLVNLSKHGIDFWDVLPIFDGFMIEIEDARRDYGERRIGAYGEIEGGDILFVIYTWRGERRRIISARRAGSDESEDYRRAKAATR